jgi:hypothetical protein
MSPTFEFNVKNENLLNCRIVAEFFSIREFFSVFRRTAQLSLLSLWLPRGRWFNSKPWYGTSRGVSVKCELKENDVSSTQIIPLPKLNDGVNKCVASCRPKYNCA